MRPVNGIKKVVKRGKASWVCTDGRSWERTELANLWQKKLNKKAIKALEGKKLATVVEVKKVHGKTGRNYHGKNGNVGVSPEKRRAMQAFVIKHNIVACVKGSGTVISMNRLLWALEKNKKAVKDFAELFAIQ